MATATPAPLSVAPVPACQESMWPPSMTTSSFRSLPGISAIVVFNCKHELRNNLRRRLVIGLDLARSVWTKRIFHARLWHGRGLNKDGAAIAQTAGINQDCSTLVMEKLILAASENLRPALFGCKPPSASWSWLGCVGQSEQIFLIAPCAHRLETRFHISHFSG